MHTMITRPRGMKTPHMICGGRGGEGSVRGEEGELDDVFVRLTPNNPLKESEWSNNGQLVILVSGHIIHTPLKQRRGRGGRERRAHHYPIGCDSCPAALLALHEEWCGEGGTHFLVELALRTSVAASLREGDAAAVWGHHAEVGHSQPVIRGVNTTAVEL